MICDIHAHMVGLPSGRGGNYLCPVRQRSLPLRFLLRGALRTVHATREGEAGERIDRLVRDWVAQSRVDQVVLLALDGAFRQDGTADLEHTQLIVGNDYVADFSDGDSKLRFGASVHPYRRDALDELDRVIRRGAVLIKWLPSAQNIAPDDPRCVPFYERMAELRIPLLSHTGVEHTLAKFDNSLNDPRRLEAALRAGVTVIAAHCGTRMFLYERSHFKQWASMAKEHSGFYGDISAFALPLHGIPLRRILNDPDLLSKAVYGSDFPTPPWPLWSMDRLGVRRAMALRKIANPFDQCYQMMQELGVPASVFERGARLLRNPAEQSVANRGVA